MAKKQSKASSRIFLSHIGQEAELAGYLKSQIEKDFLGLVDIFVSTQEQSISLGEKWLDNVSTALKDAAAMLVLCSPWSIARPWINFEAGAGWVKGIPVVPLCHSGMTPVQLPTPLNSLQGTLMTDVEKLQKIYNVIAHALGSQAPQGQHDELVAKISGFESRYQRENLVLRELKAINEASSELIGIFKKVGANANTPINGFPQPLFLAIKPSLDRLKAQNLVRDFAFNVNAFVFDGPHGTLGDLVVNFSKELCDTLKDFKG